ncbi:antitoxin Xre/MbcA/ParS toxin-binding domain-containing protein [Rhodoblastus sp.]|uniref:antitoxin Xre/MbcA/ParS toxin-binding domain-containing protein n=1 Tax=Rhodoblastus sp. TaxID=1962975 RepID=UPI0035B4DA33
MTRAPTKKDIRDRAADVIGSPELARDWFAMPAIAFGWRKPRDMLATAGRIAPVASTGPVTDA